jgi:hypothetical protein
VKKKPAAPAAVEAMKAQTDLERVQANTVLEMLVIKSREISLEGQLVAAIVPMAYLNEEQIGSLVEQLMPKAEQRSAPEWALCETIMRIASLLKNAGISQRANFCAPPAAAPAPAPGAPEGAPPLATVPDGGKQE